EGILGPEAVVTAVLGGGRSPADQVRLVPWGDERAPARPGPPPLPPAGAAPGAASAPVVVPAGGGAGRRAGRGRAVAEPPWPGRIPPPAPAVVLPTPLPADVRDAAGEPVVVSARLTVSAAPARLTVGDGRPAEITGWAGPWPVDERWWAPAEARRRARFQVCLADGAALLLAVEGGQWLVEAIYD
ncbi:DNA polymerase Y family protein, partial [Micromonospora aurantiaca]